MSSLKSVFLADFAYPCVAYIIQRLGLSHDIEAILLIHGERYNATTTLEIGDVLVWERSDSLTISDATLTIGKHGPVTTKLRLGRHFGVYEGNGLVSDITFDGDTYYPRIRLMPLSEHPVPRIVLRHNMLVDIQGGQIQAALKVLGG
jgi:hypothetical protein